MPDSRVIAIAGPTGSGKTELAIELARQFDAEIVNADSRQVYRYLDIGSAKPTLTERAAVPHHVFDVAEPEEPFDAARYRTLALAAIRDIQGRGKRVLLVGGTGLYIKVVAGGLFDGPPRDPAIRAELYAVEAASPGELHRRLGEVDAEAAARLHPNDHVRLVRALEVYRLTDKPISEWQSEHRFTSQEIDVATIAIQVDRQALYERIGRRCHAMLDRGLEEEVRGLLDRYAFDLPSFQSPGYREIGEYVRGLCSREDAVARMAQATRRLAKRQLTWLRGAAGTIWCEPDIASFSQHATRLFEE